MTRPPDAERGGARSLFGARAGGQPPPAGEDELFTDEELSWEDDGAEPVAEQSAPGWPIPRRRVDGEVAPYRDRKSVV